MHNEQKYQSNQSSSDGKILPRKTFRSLGRPYSGSFDVVNRNVYMMASWNGNIFRIIGPLCGGERSIPLTKASDAELWCFSLIYAWTTGWVNNQDAGDSGHHSTHYDISVILAASPVRCFVDNCFKCEPHKEFVCQTCVPGYESDGKYECRGKELPHKQFILIH